MPWAATVPSASVDNCVAGDRGVASAQAAASGYGAAAAAVPAPALEARGLAFRYGEGAGPVFSDLSLTVGRGEVVLVMGASGCGKSTLALCLAGLYPT